MQDALIENGKSEAEIVKGLDEKIRYEALALAAGSFFDDLIQEGRMALLGAIRTYDPTRGVRLWTYAKKRVVGAMQTFLTNEGEEPCRNLQPEGEDGDGNLEQAVDCLPSAAPSAELLLEQKEEAGILVLSEGERALLWQLYGEDQSSRDLGQALGVSHASVLRMKQGALEKLLEHTRRAA